MHIGAAALRRGLLRWLRTSVSCHLRFFFLDASLRVLVRWPVSGRRRALCNLHSLSRSSTLRTLWGLRSLSWGSWLLLTCRRGPRSRLRHRGSLLSAMQVCLLCRLRRHLLHRVWRLVLLHRMRRNWRWLPHIRQPHIEQLCRGKCVLRD